MLALAVIVNHCNDKVAYYDNSKLTTRPYMYIDHDHDRTSFTRAY